jgi:hypothetical protein
MAAATLSQSSELVSPTAQAPVGSQAAPRDTLTTTRLGRTGRLASGLAGEVLFPERPSRFGSVAVLLGAARDDPQRAVRKWPCGALAWPQGAPIQTSTSSGFVRRTSIALGWKAPTSAFGWVSGTCRGRWWSRLRAPSGRTSSWSTWRRSRSADSSRRGRRYRHQRPG